MNKNKKQAAAFILVLLACSMECENVILWAVVSGSLLAGAAALILPGKKSAPPCRNTNGAKWLRIISHIIAQKVRNVK